MLFHVKAEYNSILSPHNGKDKEKTPKIEKKE